MVIFARSLKLFLPLFHSTRCFSAHWNANCILLCKYTLNNQIVSAFINQLQFSALGLINRCACSRRGPVGEQLNRTKTDQSYFSTLTLSYNWMSTSYDVVTIIQKACCTRSSNHCLNYAKWDKERGTVKERERDRQRGTSDPHVLSSLCLKWVRLHKVSIFGSTLTSKETAAQLVYKSETVEFTYSLQTSSSPFYLSTSLVFSLYHFLFYWGNI